MRVYLVRQPGFEPAISCVTGRRISATFPQSRIGGHDRQRSCNSRFKRPVLCRLSYIPIMVDPARFELTLRRLKVWSATVAPEIHVRHLMVGSVGVGPTYTQGFNLELSPDQLTLHKEGQRKYLVSLCP